MSNSIDFHQIEYNRTAIPAGAPIVSINGRISELLNTVKIVRAAYPEFGWAELIYEPALARSGEYIEPQDAENLIPFGSKVTICQLYSGCGSNSVPMQYSLFTGFVEKIDTFFTDKRVRLKFTVRDISAKFEKVIVTGQRINDSGRDVYLNGMPLVFNADGRNNRSVQQITYKGRSYHIFGISQNLSLPFSYSDAIYYLLCEYISCDILDMPTVEYLATLIDSIRVYDIDVDGQNLVKAIYKLCQPMGVNYCFVPNQDESGPDSCIVFYKPGRRRIVELNRQYCGETFDISRTNIHTFDSARSSWPVTKRYIGSGEFKVFEATFDLIKAWDPASEGGGVESYSTEAEDFNLVENVYRKWCLNEAGDYCLSPYNQGSAFDFSAIFQTDNYVHRRRKFLDCITSDIQGNSLETYVQVSYDSGSTWHLFEGSYDVLSDQCGIWISDKFFDEDYWAAAQTDQLRLRITASVRSDTRLTYAIADGPVNSSAEVADNILSLPAAYNYKYISPESIFYNVVSDEIDASGSVNDIEILAGHVRQQANTDRNIIEEITVTTPMVCTNFEPGDRVTTGPDSADILGIRKDARSLFWIERVEIDYDKQITKLKILRQRKYPL